MSSSAKTVEATVGFTERVISAASQGAAASVVAAGLSAVTEPVVNRMLVGRLGFSEAVRQVDVASMAKFFNTTLPTNFIKFPLFEVVNSLLSTMDIPFKGAVLGAVFTTTTLPITNYRYCMSVNQPVDFGSLYKAYWPTVLRDVIYGTVRGKVFEFLLAKHPSLANSASGRFLLTFLAVMASCVLSAPGNELRGYFLQPVDKRLSPQEFFKPDRFVRSTSIGALIMSVALGVGTLVTGPATSTMNAFKEYLNNNPLAKLALVLFAFKHYTASKQHDEQMQALEKLNRKTE